jgi:PAS domain S-box-containing protein
MLAFHDDLEAILDHVADGVTVQDQHGDLIYANASAAQALGFASPADVVAVPLARILDQFEIFDETGRPFPLADLPGRRALSGELVPAVTIRFRVLPDGDERWADVRATPIFGDDGQVRFAVNVWHDITEQKRIEIGQRYLAEASEALASSLDIEKTLQTVANLAVPHLADWCAVHLMGADQTVSQLAIAHVDPERIEWARALQERYPSDPESPYGVMQAIRSGKPTMMPEIPDDMLVTVARDAEHLRLLRHVGLKSAIIAPMLARGRGVGAITFVTAESGRRYLESDLRLAESLAYRAALAVDNARLYEAEHRLRAAAEEARLRFRTLFEEMPDAIFVFDDEGRILDANTGAGELLGVDYHDLVNALIQDVAVDHRVATMALRSLRQHGTWRGETEVRRDVDSAVPVEVWSKRLALPTGAVSIGALRDISARRAAEEAREGVLASVSHDLRNPLGTIKAHVQLLRRSLERQQAPDRERLDHGLGTIDALATRMAALLEDMFDAPRPRVGPLRLHDLVEVELVAAARRIAQDASAAAMREIEVRPKVDRLVGAWDLRGVERILLNLLSNAIKYSGEESKIFITIERIDEDDESWAEIRVRDVGIGIPSRDLARVFERYRRGSNVRGISGTGLGLASVRDIAESHCGWVAVASQEGSGTTVTVRLPLDPAARCPEPDEEMVRQEPAVTRPGHAL